MTTAATDADRSAAVGRLVRAARLVLRTNGGSARIHLEPPTLGSVKLDIVVRDGLVSATLQTQTRAASNWSRSTSRRSGRRSSGPGSR